MKVRKVESLKELPVVFDNKMASKSLGLKELGANFPDYDLESPTAFRSMVHFSEKSLLFCCVKNELVVVGDRYFRQCFALTQKRAVNKAEAEQSFRAFKADCELVQVAGSDAENWVAVADRNGGVWTAATDQASASLVFMRVQTGVKNVKKLLINNDGRAFVLGNDGSLALCHADAPKRIAERVLDFVLGFNSKEVAWAAEEGLVVCDPLSTSAGSSKLALPEELKGELHLCFCHTDTVVLVLLKDGQGEFVFWNRKSNAFAMTSDMMFFDSDRRITDLRCVFIPQMKLGIVYFDAFSTVRLFSLEKEGEYIEVDDSHLPCCDNFKGEEGCVRMIALLRTWMDAPTDSEKTEGREASDQTFFFPPFLALFGNNSKFMFRGYRDQRKAFSKQQGFKSLLKKPDNCAPLPQSVAWNGASSASAPPPPTSAKPAVPVPTAPAFRFTPPPASSASQPEASTSFGATTFLDVAMQNAKKNEGATDTQKSADAPKGIFANFGKSANFQAAAGFFNTENKSFDPQNIFSGTQKLGFLDSKPKASVEDKAQTAALPQATSFGANFFGQPVGNKSEAKPEPQVPAQGDSKGKIAPESKPESSNASQPFPLIGSLLSTDAQRPSLFGPKSEPQNKSPFLNVSSATEDGSLFVSRGNDAASGQTLTQLPSIFPSTAGPAKQGNFFDSKQKPGAAESPQPVPVETASSVVPPVFSGLFSTAAEKKEGKGFLTGPTEPKQPPSGADNKREQQASTLLGVKVEKQGDTSAQWLDANKKPAPVFPFGDKDVKPSGNLFGKQTEPERQETGREEKKEDKAAETLFSQKKDDPKNLFGGSIFPVTEKPFNGFALADKSGAGSLGTSIPTGFSSSGTSLFDRSKPVEANDIPALSTGTKGTLFSAQDKPKPIEAKKPESNSKREDATLMTKQTSEKPLMSDATVTTPFAVQPTKTQAESQGKPVVTAPKVKQPRTYGEFNEEKLSEALRSASDSLKSAKLFEKPTKITADVAPSLQKPNLAAVLKSVEDLNFEAQTTRDALRLIERLFVSGRVSEQPRAEAKLSRTLDVSQKNLQQRIDTVQEALHRLYYIAKQIKVDSTSLSRPPSQNFDYEPAAQTSSSIFNAKLFLENRRKNCEKVVQPRLVNFRSQGINPDKLKPIFQNTVNVMSAAESPDTSSHISKTILSNFDFLARKTEELKQQLSTSELEPEKRSDLLVDLSHIHVPQKSIVAKVEQLVKFKQDLRKKLDRPVAMPIVIEDLTVVKTSLAPAVQSNMSLPPKSTAKSFEAPAEGSKEKSTATLSLFGAKNPPMKFDRVDSKTAEDKKDAGTLEAIVTPQKPVVLFGDSAGAGLFADKLQTPEGAKKSLGLLFDKGEPSTPAFKSSFKTDAAKPKAEASEPAEKPLAPSKFPTSPKDQSAKSAAGVSLFDNANAGKPAAMGGLFGNMSFLNVKSEGTAATASVSEKKSETPKNEEKKALFTLENKPAGSFTFSKDSAAATLFGPKPDAPKLFSADLLGAKKNSDAIKETTVEGEPKKELPAQDKQEEKAEKEGSKEQNAKGTLIAPLSNAGASSNSPFLFGLNKAGEPPANGGGFFSTAPKASGEKKNLFSAPEKAAGVIAQPATADAGKGTQATEAQPVTVANAEPKGEKEPRETRPEDTTTTLSPVEAKPSQTETANTDSALPAKTNQSSAPNITGGLETRKVKTEYYDAGDMPSKKNAPSVAVTSPPRGEGQPSGDIETSTVIQKNPNFPLDPEMAKVVNPSLASVPSGGNVGSIHFIPREPMRTSNDLQMQKLAAQQSSDSYTKIQGTEAGKPEPDWLKPSPGANFSEQKKPPTESLFKNSLQEGNAASFRTASFAENLGKSSSKFIIEEEDGKQPTQFSTGKPPLKPSHFAQSETKAQSNFASTSFGQTPGFLSASQAPGAQAGPATNSFFSGFSKPQDGQAAPSFGQKSFFDNAGSSRGGPSATQAPGSSQPVFGKTSQLGSFAAKKPEFEFGAGSAGPGVLNQTFNAEGNPQKKREISLGFNSTGTNFLSQQSSGGNFFGNFK